MAEPRIQYAKTSDGVSIAYYTMGEGPALLSYAPLGGHSNLRLEWQYPELRQWFERLAENHTLVRLDGRGWGLSQRVGFEFSVEGYLLDQEAVMERAGLERHAIFALAGTVSYAIAYAARNPDQVSHLILWEPFQLGTPYDEQERTLQDLLEKDWVLYTEAMAHNTLGWSQGQAAHGWARFIRESITAETWRAAQPVIRSLDISGLIGSVQAPTLLLSRAASKLHDETQLREFAAALPDARVVLLDGREPAPFLGDVDAVLAAIDEFVGGAPARPTAVRSSSSGGLVTILFTDLTSSTALTQRLGDAKAQELVRAHNAIVREALAAQGGTEIKHTGDGIMASFPTASGALECAVSIQRNVAQRNEPDLAVHVGLNAGEPVAEESDLFGTSVQLARRICDHASTGQILVSNVVRELSAGKGFLFADIGEVVPKGFEEPVRLYEVRWSNDG